MALKLPTAVVDIDASQGKEIVVESRRMKGNYIAPSHTWRNTVPCAPRSPVSINLYPQYLEHVSDIGFEEFAPAVDIVEI